MTKYDKITQNNHLILFYWKSQGCLQKETKWQMDKSVLVNLHPRMEVPLVKTWFIKPSDEQIILNCNAFNFRMHELIFAPRWSLNIKLWKFGSCPSSIYSWSIGHILEHEFFCLGRLGSQGSKGKKWIWGILSNFWGCFFNF